MPGSPCREEDSASVKRLPMHPLGPTGGWGTAAENLVDYESTRDLESNYLTLSNGCISGFVRFKQPGYLRARSYDDYYGSVYCGWCHEKLPLRPTEKFVYVRLGLCHVGDGGLDQIHEVAWFPEGKEEGIIIYSSAHATENPAVTAADLYRKDLLGNGYYFNDHLADQAIAISLRRGDFEKAERILGDSREVLSGMKGAIYGTTGKAIPKEEMWRAERAMIQAYELGLALKNDRFATVLADMRKTLNNPGYNYDNHNCAIYRKMLPIYSWLGARLSGDSKASIAPESLERSVVGHDPVEIHKFMTAPSLDELFMKTSMETGYFWAAMRSYLLGDLSTAGADIEKYLSEAHGGIGAFETAAAARLKQILEL